jgi:cytoplasmic iron level regulating protein YaaA (DUF328/UPF0246 family)
VLAFNGDVYEGLQARSLKPDELDWAQQPPVHPERPVRRAAPLDRMQPYRLEMGTRAGHRRGRNLYQFWGRRSPST